MATRYRSTRPASADRRNKAYWPADRPKGHGDYHPTPRISFNGGYHDAVQEHGMGLTRSQHRKNRNGLLLPAGEEFKWYRYGYYEGTIAAQNGTQERSSEPAWTEFYNSLTDADRSRVDWLNGLE